MEKLTPNTERTIVPSIFMKNGKQAFGIMEGNTVVLDQLTKEEAEYYLGTKEDVN